MMRSGILSACLFLPLAAPEHADIIIRNARIYTVDPRLPWAEAIAIKGETIADVGSNDAIGRRRGPDTIVIDLGGKFVCPGFIDSHIHFLDGSLSLSQVALDSARSLPEMLDRIRAYAVAHPDEPWILGRGWIYAYVDGGRLPTRQDLDSVVPSRPVYLEAYDGHTAWVNTKALEIAGIKQGVRVEGYGEIVTEPKSGLPTGVLKEDAAMQMVRKAVPDPSREKKLAALKLGLAEAARHGITSVQDAMGTPEELDLYEELRRSGDLTLRMYMAMSVDKQTTAADLDRFEALGKLYQGSWVKTGAVKIFMDGVIESHTAALLEPYTDDPTQSGQPDYDTEEIHRFVADLDRRGFQILTHAIGDRSVRMVLDAYEEAARARQGPPRRHRIEHIETISSADVPRFAHVGVIASMQPYHASPDITGVWARNVGLDRAARAFAWHDLRAAGARVIHGSDWPVVTLDPLVGLHAAVTREDLAGNPTGGWIPAQRLSLEQALLGYTLDAAYGSFDEAIKGSIESGKLADLAVLSEDLFHIQPRNIPQVRVLLTIVGGRAAYVAPDLPDQATALRLQELRRPPVSPSPQAGRIEHHCP